ncbi:PTS sugar transporter subunit IIA [Weissella kandleri]|uniref:PTS sugar transporter subunit IIA n=1 Tax=Weissella kandleri TaxID=1616 RepID=UPI00387E3B90
MLSKSLNENTIRIADDMSKIEDWRTAIALAAKPLLDNDVIKSTYVDAMIKNVEESGPYINIGPKIALAHAKSSDDVSDVGIALLKTKRDVNLVDEQHPVSLWFVLAAPDSTAHLKMLQELTQLLMNQEALGRLNNAQTVQEILNVVENV